MLSVVTVYPNLADKERISLAEKELFFRCDVCVESKDVISFWFVAVKLFSVHVCKVWFGLPTELWSAFTTDIYFLPLTCIESRVAYRKKTVDFGLVIGDDSVIIAVPLSSSAFHSDLS